MKKFQFLLFLSLFLAIYPNIMEAKPQYSLLSGNRCVNCHTSTSGGGMRNGLGFYSKVDVGHLGYDAIGLETLKEIVSESNGVADDMLLYGFDVRFQMAKIGSTVSPKRDFFGMQYTPYIQFNLIDWFSFEASYNFAEALYPAQQNAMAAINIKPSAELPQLKVGYFQPQITTRWDDHTVLTRRAVGIPYGLNQLVAPDYNEFGAEINYEGLKWLSLSAGLFSAKNMTEIKFSAFDYTFDIMDTGSLSQVYRVTFAPRFFDHYVNTMFGGSMLLNKDYNIMSAFVGVGLSDDASLMFEYVRSKKENDSLMIRETNNFLLNFTYQFADYLLFDARAEYALTNSDVTRPDKPELKNKDYIIKQYVLGLHYNPIAFIELRPECRIIDTSIEGYHLQYAMQLHLYY